MMLLASDLDGTFLGGNDRDKRLLYSIIHNEPQLKLVFVTGRSLPSVLTLLQETELPFPDYCICDVGATVVKGKSLEPVLPLQLNIRNRWPGDKIVEDLFKEIPGLVRQQVPQHLRVSYFLDQRSKLAGIETLANSIGCDAVYSNNKYLDILPKSVSKGSTLSQLLEAEAIDTKSVLVAGDTLNDLSMFQCGFNGVAVGNSEHRLIKATKGWHNVYHALAEGAGGILEYMRLSARFSVFLGTNSIFPTTTN